MNLGIYGGITIYFLMRFLNHHYTLNIDGTTFACARLKRTLGAIKITKHSACETNSPEIDWGKTSMPSFIHKGRMRVHATDWHREEASLLPPRKGGSTGDPLVPKDNKSPHQEIPLPASCT